MPVLTGYQHRAGNMTSKRLTNTEDKLARRLYHPTELQHSDQSQPEPVEESEIEAPELEGTGSKGHAKLRGLVSQAMMARGVRGVGNDNFLVNNL